VLARQVPQPAPDPVAHDRVADDAADDEADLWRCIGVISPVQMDHEVRSPGATAAADGQRELSTSPHPVPGRQHGGRRRSDPIGPIGQTEMRARPLRRREDRIARPARVRMRSRKPCFLWRRRLFG
jgi:hypothetical protein